MAVRSNTTGALLALAFITFVGASFLVMAVFTHIHTKAELHTLTGTLQNWEYHQRKGHTTVYMFFAGTHNTFEDQYIDKEDVQQYMQVGKPVEWTVLNTDTPALNNGTFLYMRSLRIDGHAVDPIETHIASERKVYHVQFALIGLFLIAVSIFGAMNTWRRWQAPRT